MGHEWDGQSGLADALSRIPSASTTETTADVVCSVLVSRLGVERVAVLGWIGSDPVLLAPRSVPGWTPGRVLEATAGIELRRRARSGPWSEEWTLPSTGTTAEPAPVAFAPLRSHDRLIVVLAMAADCTAPDRPALAVG